MRGENKRLCSSSNEVYRRLCPVSQNVTQKVERKTHTKQQQVKRHLYTPLVASVILSLGYLQNQCNFLVHKIYKYRLPINYHFCYIYNYYLHLFIGEPTCGGFLIEVEFSYWISQQTLFRIKLLEWSVQFNRCFECYYVLRFIRCKTLRPKMITVLPQSRMHLNLPQNPRSKKDITVVYIVVRHFNLTKIQ